MLVLALGCSSSPGTAHDAGQDETGADDASGDACVFPLCSGSSSGPSGADADEDGPATCAALASQVASLEGAAKACDPRLGQQCDGTTQGTCCPITVSAANDTAVDAYEAAVQEYMAQCSPKCLGALCPAAPSLTCNATSASTGTCQ